MFRWLLFNTWQHDFIIETVGRGMDGCYDVNNNNLVIETESSAVAATLLPLIPPLSVMIIMETTVDSICTYNCHDNNNIISSFWYDLATEQERVHQLGIDSIHWTANYCILRLWTFHPRRANSISFWYNKCLEKFWRLQMFNQMWISTLKATKTTRGQ